MQINSYQHTMQNRDSMRKPNILFILIDDLGIKDLGCYGSSFYETPHLDRLASEGMIFKHAYASCPVCSPTRASILSGKYPARIGMTQWIGGDASGKLKDVPYLHYLPLEEKSIALTLKENGYQTWHVGKWHLGDQDFFPENHGFERNIGGCHQGSPHNGYFSPWDIEGLENAEDGTYLTDFLTDRAIDLIENREDRPFFMHLSHYAVHTPLNAPENLVRKYEEKARRMGLDSINPIEVGEHFWCLHKEHLQIERRTFQSHPIYAAMIENLDTNIGRTLLSIKEQGLENNTIVVFTSDNGGLSSAEGSPTCNAPYTEGKGWNYEGGTRVCQLIKWPEEVRASSECNQAVTSTDFYPTILEACGLDLMPEQHRDGESLLPLLKESGALERKTIYWHYPHYSNQGGTPSSSCVYGDWKLIQFFEEDRFELYNLKDDPSEKMNLADQEPDRLQEMSADLKDWQVQIEALIPEPNLEYSKLTKRPKVPNNSTV
jgi:arylsulfatase A-like enzyme